MKTLIVFREGHSGNYLKAVVQNYAIEHIQHRVNELHYKELRDITLTHDVDYLLHKRQYSQVLRILPTRKIFAAIFNNFSKKIVIEMTPPGEYADWHRNTVRWYDQCYYNQVEYRRLIQADIAQNQYANIIDFDQLLNESYIADVLQRYFGQTINDNQKELVAQYKQQQLTADVDTLDKKMSIIIGNITDTMMEENPWFFTNCVLRYELANGFAESDRTWSMDACRTVQKSQDLLQLAYEYQQFKH